MSITSSRLAVAMVSLIGVVLAAPVRAQTTPGIVEIGDVVIIEDLRQTFRDMPLTLRVGRSGSIAIPGIGEVEVVGLTVEQVDERLRRDGKMLKTVTRRVDGPGPRVYLDIFKRGKKPTRMERTPGPGPGDVVPACPRCG
jgi:protein involved in polysaccharide export with SLBB domain